MMGLPSLHALDEYRLGAQRARIWRRNLKQPETGIPVLVNKVRLRSGINCRSFLTPISAAGRSDGLRAAEPTQYRSVVQADHDRVCFNDVFGMSKESAIRCVSQNSETSW